MCCWRRWRIVYPHSPWQRGSNENANRLIREYLPKGTDLSGVSQTELNLIANRLNDRPRKILNYETPREVFVRLLEAEQSIQQLSLGL